MSDIIPNIFLKDQAEKLVDFPNDQMKVALMTGAYDECTLRDKTSYDQISGNELTSGAGYPTGGIPVTGQTVTVNNDADEVVYDIDDVGMAVTGGTLGPVRYGVLYDLDNSNHLVYIFDFGEDKTVNDGAQFKIKIDDNGLMKAKQLYNCEV